MALSKKERSKIAEDFERLRSTYKKGWLVRDTEAFEQYCFDKSDEISEMLQKAARK